jgi:hypothetical protein
VLWDSIEDLISHRWPGLEYKLSIPCPGGAEGRCAGRFLLDGLTRMREKGRTRIPCQVCTDEFDIMTLLTGYTGQAGFQSEVLEEIRDRVVSIDNGVASIRTDTGQLPGIAAQTAEIANSVRRALQIVSTEVTDCPRLFTLASAPAGSVRKRIRVDQRHYRLTLWCEYSGDEHPWELAGYDLDVTREWIARIAPYARFTFGLLAIAVPAAGVIRIDRLPQSRQPDAQAYLQAFGSVIDEMSAVTGTVARGSHPPLSAAERPAVTAGPGHGSADASLPAGQLTAAEGESLRFLRTALFREDQPRHFGGLRPVRSPSGDTLWVCKHHYGVYDPGLPDIR